MDHISFIRSSVSGHLSCLCLWAAVNKAAVSVGASKTCLSSCFYFFSEEMLTRPSSEHVGCIQPLSFISNDTLCPSFLLKVFGRLLRVLALEPECDPRAHFRRSA